MSRWTEKIERLREALSVRVGSDATVATPPNGTPENRCILRQSEGSGWVAYEYAVPLPRSILVRCPAAWSNSGRVISAVDIVLTRRLNAFTDMSRGGVLDVTDQLLWWQVHADARTFLSEWGSVADALEWPAEVLFDRAEAGAHGLVWETRRRRRPVITHDFIVIFGNAARCRAWLRRLRRF